jgi:hypothetical protein
MKREGVRHEAREIHSYYSPIPLSPSYRSPTGEEKSNQKWMTVDLDFLSKLRTYIPSNRVVVKMVYPVFLSQITGEMSKTCLFSNYDNPMMTM